MKFRRNIFAKALLMVVVIALLGAIVMGLWNWIAPAIVAGAHAIDYPRAIGLLVLCRILFGGFRGHGGCRRRMHWHQWQQWQNMTPQEREQFRDGAAPGATPPSP
ncbi:hypothetical protein [Paraburkholderia acidiphila]|uniref:Uncharacterized protein n=1 Tax=Paraburkholderia acidiphila TaxID=2571747 RepID=A0A7Z2GC38_9BURK|nr:hypothetical protein [Paraburkholderia acidiphila]QGZ59067.1 hypothetical protein FAZ97_29465 [Paraburkholderia acidiphila]